MTMQDCCLQPVLRQATLLKSWQRLSRAGRTLLCSSCRILPRSSLTWPTASVFNKTECTKAPIAPSQLSSCALSSEKGSFKGCLLRAITTSTSRKAIFFSSILSWATCILLGTHCNRINDLELLPPPSFRQNYSSFQAWKRGQGLVSVAFSIPEAEVLLNSSFLGKKTNILKKVHIHLSAKCSYRFSCRV